MTWQTPVFIIIALAAGGYSSLKFATLLKLMKAHRPALGRTDRMGDRILATILNVLGQRAVLRKPWIGIAHATIFGVSSSLRSGRLSSLPPQSIRIPTLPLLAIQSIELGFFYMTSLQAPSSWHSPLRPIADTSFVRRDLASLRMPTLS